MGVGLGDLQHSRIELSVAPHEATLRDAELSRSLDDEKEVVVGFRNDAMSRTFGEDDVVTLLVRQRSVIGFDSARSSMNEVADVAVRVAEKVRHGGRSAAHKQADVVVARHELP